MPREAAAENEAAGRIGGVRSVEELWNRVVAGAEKAGTRALLSQVRPVGLVGSRATIEVVDPSQLGYVRARLDAIRELVNRVSGEHLSVEVVGAEPKNRNQRPTQKAHEAAVSHPLVRQAVELFDARVVGVRAVRTETDCTADE